MGTALSAQLPVVDGRRTDACTNGDKIFSRVKLLAADILSHRKPNDEELNRLAQMSTSFIRLFFYQKKTI